MRMRIFQISRLGDALIVTPRRSEGDFRYQDLHVEANSVRGLLSAPDVRKLVINLEELDYFGSEFIGALISLLRENHRRGGRGCFCGATPAASEVLAQMGLSEIWPAYETCDAALAELANAP